MSSTKPLRMQGIALVQVLLITAIISILLLIMVANVQQYQRQTQHLLMVTEQQLQLHSAANTLIFSLLTENWLGPQSGAELYGWNFYNYPFNWPVPAVTAEQTEKSKQIARVKIQDINGLLDLRTANMPLSKWLQYHGLSSLQAQQILTNLQKLQSPQLARSLDFIVPGLFLQHPSELLAAPGWQGALIKQLLPVSRVEGGDFNYVNAPDSVLAALLPNAHFAILQRWRQSGNFDQFKFMTLTNITPELDGSFSTGNELLVQLTLGEQQQLLHLRLSHSRPQVVLIKQQLRQQLVY